MVWAIAVSVRRLAGHIEAFNGIVRGMVGEVRHRTRFDSSITIDPSLSR
jgi:hypothetical protein